MRSLWIEPLENRCVPTTITPTTFTDGGLGSGSLRDAVLQFNADPGAEDDIIQLLAGTYTLTIRGQDNTALRGDLDITSTAHRLIIQGEGAATVIDAGQLQDRVFQIVNPGTQVIFQGLVIRGGLAQDNGTAGTTDAQGGGILSNRGDVTLDNVVIRNNGARGGDGAYGAPGQSGVDGRSAQGGGLFATGGSLTISESTFASNQATGGRGGNGGNSSMIFGGPGGSGGHGQGGGLYSSGAMLTLTNATISTNTVRGGDGGDGGSPAGSGGSGGQGEGGGFFASGMVVTLTNATISANTVRGGDGGNGADAYPYRGGDGGGGGFGLGGGIFINAGSFEVTNGTVAFNTALTSRGGLAGIGEPSGRDGPGGPGQGGGMRNDSAVGARNTLFGNNTATAHPDISGAFASAFYNLLRDGTGSGLVHGVNGNLVGTAAMPLDPLLGPLDDNGGPTLTHALLPGSPALDAGDNKGAPEWDQRGEGYGRIVNDVIDIGAFEAQGMPAPGRSPVFYPAFGAEFDPVALLFLEGPSRRDPFYWGTWWPSE